MSATASVVEPFGDPILGEAYPWPTVYYGSLPVAGSYGWPFVNRTPEPTVSRFRGEIENLDALPTGPVIGDAVYVRDLAALLVRGVTTWSLYERSA